MIADAAHMAAAILNAIVTENQADDGYVYIDPDQAREAMILAFAAMMEARPDLATPRDIKRAAEAIGAELRAKIKAMRDSYERTGTRLWPAEIIRPQ